MVAAGHPLAAHAGFEILEEGGNAVDAGVASALAMCVLQPSNVNFGGVAPAVVFSAADAQVHTIDGVGRWPRSIAPDHFEHKHRGRIPLGVERCVVPAAPDAYLTALERFGTMSFGRVARAAIRYATDGFTVSPLLAEWFENRQAAYARWLSTQEIYQPGGKPPKSGQLLRQRDLGATLEHLVDAEEQATGKSRDRERGFAGARRAFYRGEIARTIVNFIHSEGGLLQLEDFAEYRVSFEKPVSARFDDIEIFQCGPWSQGPVLGIALNIAKGFDLKAAGHNSTDYIHILVEALKLAFADRYQYFGDPSFTEVPIRDLLSEQYAMRRRTLVDRAKAAPDLPPPGEPSIGSVRGASSESTEGPTAANTTYVCTVDRDGNAFSSTPSDGTDTTPIIPGLGIVCSGRGMQSWPRTGSANSVAPGKRPMLTPAPAIALRHGLVHMPFGTPGGTVQPQVMLQFFLNHHVFGMTVQEAIDAPRFVSASLPRTADVAALFPQGGANTVGTLFLEAGIDPSVGDELADRAHRITWWDQHEWSAGGVCAIVADREHRVLRGGADPRRAAYVIGR